jgi:nucleoside-diphosphate-sugar epimerase
MSPAVLVTGVTGFIGREIARRLLAADRRVLALARSRAGVDAGERVARSVGLAPDGHRLDVVDHDLAAGPLDASIAASLRADVEAVIHCAGDTAFAPACAERFRAGHVEGPLALLHALAGGRLATWTQMSTAFVCGRRAGRVMEDEGDAGQAFHNTYERVKLDAESAIRAAGARRGVGVRVLRPGVVVGAAPRTAGGSASGRFFEFIRLVAALGRLARGARVGVRIAGRPGARFNAIAVEDLAAATIALTDHPGAAGHTCHLVASDAPTQAALLATIADCLGVEGLRTVEGVVRDPSPVEARIGRMADPYREYLSQDVSFDDRIARRLLTDVGVSHPRLDTAAVHRLVDAALTAPHPVLAAPLVTA